MSAEWCAGQGQKPEDETLFSSSSEQLGGGRSGNELQKNRTLSEIRPVTLRSLPFQADGKDTQVCLCPDLPKFRVPAFGQSKIYFIGRFHPRFTAHPSRTEETQPLVSALENVLTCSIKPASRRDVNKREQNKTHFPSLR